MQCHLWHGSFCKRCDAWLSRIIYRCYGNLVGIDILNVLCKYALQCSALKILCLISQIIGCCLYNVGPRLPESAKCFSDWSPEHTMTLQRQDRNNISILSLWHCLWLIFIACRCTRRFDRVTWHLEIGSSSKRKSVSTGNYRNSRIHKMYNTLVEIWRFDMH